MANEIYSVVLEILRSDFEEQVEIFEFEGKDEIQNLKDDKTISEEGHNSEGTALGPADIHPLAWITILQATYQFYHQFKRLIYKSKTDQELVSQFEQTLEKAGLDKKLASKIAKKHSKIAISKFKSITGRI